MTKPVTLDEQIAGSTFTVLSGGYAVVRAGDVDGSASGLPPSRCFAAIFDAEAGERTLIVERSKAADVLDPAYPAHGTYRAIRVNLLVPFEGVGFIHSVSGAIAGRGVNILAVSSYSFDYFLVKEEDLEQAKGALFGLGMREVPFRRAR